MGRKPIDTITADTIAVAIAVPVMLDEFRTRLMKPDITPYLLSSTCFIMEALLGG